MENEHKTSRSQILQSALELFALYGYSGTGVADIVKKAGVTKPTLYYFFSNKEGIYEAVWNEFSDSHIKQLKEIAVYKPDVENYENDVFPLLVRIVSHFFDLTKINPLFFTLSLSSLYTPVETECSVYPQIFHQKELDILTTMFNYMGNFHGNMKGHSHQLAFSFLSLAYSYSVLYFKDQESVSYIQPQDIVKQFMHGIFSL